MSAEVVWSDVAVGNVSVGDLVRVKEDAYKGLVGDMHNGRYCEVIEISSGDVIVKSIDGITPQLTQTHHSPHVLERIDLS